MKAGHWLILAAAVVAVCGSIIAAVPPSEPAGFQVEVRSTGSYATGATSGPTRISYWFFQDGSKARAYHAFHKVWHYDLAMPTRGETVDLYENGTTKATWPLRKSFNAFYDLDEYAKKPQITIQRGLTVLGRPAVALSSDVASGGIRTQRTVHLVELFPGKWAVAEGWSKLTYDDGKVDELRETAVSIQPVGDDLLKSAIARKEVKPSLVDSDIRAITGEAPCIECMLNQLKGADALYEKRKAELKK